MFLNEAYPLNIFVDYSKKSHKYDEAKNKTELISFKPIEDGLRINTLYMMLKEDNVNMFHQMQLQRNNIYNLARRLRRQKQKQTLPPVDMEALKNYTTLRPMDINNLINLLPPPPAPKQQKKRGPKPKQSEDITDNMTAKERRRIYIRNYMREYRKKD